MAQLGDRGCGDLLAGSCFSADEDGCIEIGNRDDSVAETDHGVAGAKEAGNRRWIVGGGRKVQAQHDSARKSHDNASPEIGLRKNPALNERFQIDFNAMRARP
jgi:hypothetical protein